MLLMRSRAKKVAQQKPFIINVLFISIKFNCYYFDDQIIASFHKLLIFSIIIIIRLFFQSSFGDK